MATTLPSSSHPSLVCNRRKLISLSGNYTTSRSVVCGLLARWLILALAAIHIVSKYQKPETPLATDTIAVASPQLSTHNTQPEEADTLTAEPRIFDNVRLDTMLMEMADHYHVGVKFEHEEARQLRFHFVWKREDSLSRVVEKLNTFKAVNIGMEDKKLVVR